jgi:hypothetical protein
MLFKNKKPIKSKIARTRLFLLVPLMFILAACAGLSNNLSSNNYNLTASSNTTSSNQNSLIANLAKDEINLVAIEVSKIPNRVTYSSDESISTLGGELRLSFSDYSVKYISMNDQMIDVKTLDTSRLGQSRINLIHRVNEKEARTSYIVNIVAFTVPVSKVELELRNLDIVQDNSHQFNLAVYPFNAKFEKVEWLSSDETIASVSQNGLMNALNPGNVIISVKVDNLFTYSALVNVLLGPVKFEWVNPTLRIISFTTVGSTNWIVPTGVYEIEYLVVGGGGGGGYAWDSVGAGGGGSGMVLTGKISVDTNITYELFVGAGGVGANFSSIQSTNGQNSNFSSIVALGGGRGRNAREAGVGGVSRQLGGSSQLGNTTATTGGFGGSGAGSVGSGGGGGGSRGSGGNGSQNTPAGTGGSGTVSLISGSSLTYGVGGNGGTGNNGITNGTNGTENRGNGGGGGSANGSSNSNGGAGGSGIVIIRFYQYELIRNNN